MVIEIETSPENLPPEHPLRKVSFTLRIWLILLSAITLWNAWVATEILLKGWLQPIPFLILTVAALIWAVNPWSVNTTVIASAVIAVGLSLRAIEVAAWADYLDSRSRATASSVWFFLGITSLLYGILNLLVISRVKAGLLDAKV